MAKMYETVTEETSETDVIMALAEQRFCFNVQLAVTDAGCKHVHAFKHGF